MTQFEKVNDSDNGLAAWLAVISRPISDYLDRRKLIHDLEMLSDHHLNDVGICREAIEEFADAVSRTIDTECCKMICRRVVNPSEGS